MEIITTKYIKIIENNTDKNNNLKICFCYDIGGRSWATGKEKPRGYYISASPVHYSCKNGLVSEEYTAFTGVYDLLEGCARKSKKAEAAALEKFSSYEKMVLQYYYNKYGYILEG